MQSQHRWTNVRLIRIDDWTGAVSNPLLAAPIRHHIMSVRTNPYHWLIYCSAVILPSFSPLVKAADGLQTL